MKNEQNKDYIWKITFILIIIIALGSMCSKAPKNEINSPKMTIPVSTPTETVIPTYEPTPMPVSTSEPTTQAKEETSYSDSSNKPTPKTAFCYIAGAVFLFQVFSQLSCKSGENIV